MSLATVTAMPGAADYPSDEEAFALWEMHMNAAGCAPRTIKERRIIFKALGRFLEIPVASASRYELIRWLGRPDLSPKTRQNYKSFLHTFFTLLQDEGMRLDNPGARLPRGKSPRIEANPFSTDDVEKLLNSGIYGRTRMKVLLAAYQGFRAVEIAATSGLHINWETKEILTVEAKGGFEVWRPLHPVIVDYAEAHPTWFPKDSYWFPGIGPNSDTHINASSVSNGLSAAVKRAGIAHRPHQLRAWFANELFEAGAETKTVQDAMRHANPNTLRHYVKPSMVKIREAMSQLPTVRIPAGTVRS